MNFRDSPYTPFLRRFTDERAADLAETVTLYKRVRDAFHSTIWAQPDAIERVSNHVVERVTSVVDLPDNLPIANDLDKFQRDLLGLERTIFSLPEVDFSRPISLKEQVDLNRHLRAQEYFLAHQDRISEQLLTAIGNISAGLIQSLPQFAESAFMVPLIALLPNPKDVVARIIGTLCAQELVDVGLFTAIQERIYENICKFSGVPPDGSSKKPLITADEADLAPADLVNTYLSGTPLQSLFFTPVPFAIPERTRFEHTAVIAGTGWGKTQLLQSIILSDLQKDDPPCLIVLDSTGQMVERIQWLAEFNGRVKDRILIIDPAHSPSLNMFDVSTPRFNAYTPEQKEDIQTDVVALFNYIFASGEYDLSGQMGVAFTYAVRLILSRAGATIIDLRHILEETPKTWQQSAFAEDIRRLDADSLAFFQHHFFSDSLKATRASIARRLHGLLTIPAFRRMFTASANTLDLFSEMQKGTIVLVNTNANLLKEDGMALFGRYVIARTMTAAFERATIKNHQRKPAFLIIDEAAPYFDDTFDALLTRVRQFKVGVLIAFQHLEQTGDRLRSAIAANTSIKYAGRLSYADRRWMAHEMETTPDFIQAQEKDTRDPPQWTQFACHALGYTKSAISLTVPFGTLENQPAMTSAQHAAMLQRNKTRVTSLPRESPPAQHPTAPHSPIANPEDNPAAQVTTGGSDSRPPVPNSPPEEGLSPEPVASNDPHSGQHTDPATKWGND